MLESIFPTWELDEMKAYIGYDLNLRAYLRLMQCVKLTRVKMSFRGLSTFGGGENLHSNLLISLSERMYMYHLQFPPRSMDIFVVELRGLETAWRQR